MLNRFWESLRFLMAEPDDLRTLPTCDLSVSDAARIELLMDELQVSAFSLAVQAEERQRLGRAVLVARDAQSLTLRFADADVASSRLNHRVNLVGASSHGLLVFTLDLVRVAGTGLWRGDRPTELLCVQSRRHRRVRIAGELRRRATLTLMLPYGPLRLLDLSEEGAGLQLAAAVDMCTRMGEARLSLDECAIRIGQVRVCHCRRDGDAWNLGVALEGIRSDDQRMMRRWLNEAECRMRAEA
jgi:hypothetical protein